MGKTITSRAFTSTCLVGLLMFAAAPMAAYAQAIDVGFALPPDVLERIKDYEKSTLSKPPGGTVAIDAIKDRVSYKIDGLERVVRVTKVIDAAGKIEEVSEFTGYFNSSNGTFSDLAGKIIKSDNPLYREMRGAALAQLKDLKGEAIATLELPQNLGEYKNLGGLIADAKGVLRNPGELMASIPGADGIIELKNLKGEVVALFDKGNLKDTLGNIISESDPRFGQMAELAGKMKDLSSLGNLSMDDVTGQLKDIGGDYVASMIDGKISISKLGGMVARVSSAGKFFDSAGREIIGAGRSKLLGYVGKALGGIRSIRGFRVAFGSGGERLAIAYTQKNGYVAATYDPNTYYGNPSGRNLTSQLRAAGFDKASELISIGNEIRNGSGQIVAKLDAGVLKNPLGAVIDPKSPTYAAISKAIGVADTKISATVNIPIGMNVPATNDDDRTITPAIVTRLSSEFSLDTSTGEFKDSSGKVTARFNRENGTLIASDGKLLTPTDPDFGAYTTLLAQQVGAISGQPVAVADRRSSPMMVPLGVSF